MGRDDEKNLVDTYRRFGTFGPVYRVVAVHEEKGRQVADVELPESGQKATVPLESVLSDPVAD